MLPGAAASVVALALLATALLSGRPVPDDRGPTVPVHVNGVVRLLTDDASGLPPHHARPWEPGPGRRWMSARARAVRIGARHAGVLILSRQRMHQTRLAYYGRDSLALALVARASEEAAMLAAENLRDLSRLSRGERAAEAYARVADEAARRDFWGHAASLAGDRMPSDHAAFVVLGGWLEAGRVAAHRGDRDFFLRAGSRAIAAEMARLPRLSREQRAALERARVLSEEVGRGVGDAAASSSAVPGELSAALTRALALLAD